MQTCWRKGIQMWVDGNPGSAGTRPSLRLMSLFYIDSVLAVLGLHRCGRDWGVGGGGRRSLLQCLVFSLRWPLLFRSTGSRVQGLP